MHKDTSGWNVRLDLLHGIIQVIYVGVMYKQKLVVKEGENNNCLYILHFYTQNQNQIETFNKSHVNRA